MTTNPSRPLIAFMHDAGNAVDATEVLEALRDLRTLIERRSRFPWNLVPRRRMGRRNAIPIDLKTRVAVDDVCSPFNYTSSQLRSYSVADHGDIAIRFSHFHGMRHDECSCALDMIDYAVRAVSASAEGPNPLDIMAGLSSMASGGRNDGSIRGWFMPTQFSPLQEVRNAGIPTDSWGDRSGMPYGVIITRHLRTDAKGFDLDISPMFVSVEEGQDVVAAMRDAPVLASLRVQA